MKMVFYSLTCSLHSIAQPTKIGTNKIRKMAFQLHRPVSFSLYWGTDDPWYASIVRMKNMELKSSALPTTPVTASVWIGWILNRSVATNDIGEKSWSSGKSFTNKFRGQNNISDCFIAIKSIAFRSVEMSLWYKTQTVACRQTFKAWYPIGCNWCSQ